MKSTNLRKAAIVYSLVYSSVAYCQTVIGSGTANNIPKFTAASTIGNSQITDNGTTVSLGTASVAIGNAITNSGDFVSIIKNQNLNSQLGIRNSTAGTAASSSFYAWSVGGIISMSANNVSYTDNGIFEKRAGVINATGTGGINIGTSTAAQLSLWTSNIRRLNITSTGSVGIGTATPDKWFTVVSPTANTQIAKFADDARYIGIGRDEVAAFDLAGSPANLYLGGQKLSILTNGNVGIGTTTPTKKLQVVGDAQIDNLSFANFSNSSWVDANNALLFNYFSRKDTYINTAWSLQTDPTTGITTATQDGGQVNMGAKVSLTNSLKLGWDGNGVDLNTSIEVNQNANYASAVKVKTWNNSIKAFAIQDPNNKNPFLVNGDGRTTINAAVKTDKYFVINDVSISGSPIETFAISGNGYTKINVANAAAMANVFDVYDINNNLQLFRVKTDGHVFAREVEIRNTTQSFPDYVFANEYKLMPLSEVEKYIDSNKHLPGFEKGEEYDQYGIKTSELIYKQQEKIEELTLYIIELEKRMKAIEIANKKQ